MTGGCLNPLSFLLRVLKILITFLCFPSELILMLHVLVIHRDYMPQLMWFADGTLSAQSPVSLLGLGHWCLLPDAQVHLLILQLYCMSGPANKPVACYCSQRRPQRGMGRQPHRLDGMTHCSLAFGLYESGMRLSLSIASLALTCLHQSMPAMDAGVVTANSTPQRGA